MAQLNHDNSEFWAACQREELRVPHCQQCGTWIYPPRRMCPECWSDDVTAELIDGRGHIVSYSLPRVPPDADPIVTGIVALEENPEVRFLAQISDCAPGDVSIGMPVAVQWRGTPGGIVPDFRPSQVPE